MKTFRILSIVVLLLMLAAFLPRQAVDATAIKVDVCHALGNGDYILINISDNAFQTHLDHGDAAPGDPVPGMEGKVFTAECAVVDEFEYVETIVVNSDGQLASTLAALDLGIRYQLRASGYYDYGPGDADAKFSYRPASIANGGPAGWYDMGTFNPAAPYGLQVTIFDGNFDKPLLPAGWIEPYNDAHQYTAVYYGTGDILGMFIWDDVYTDNVGSITVDIYRWN